MIQDH